MYRVAVQREFVSQHFLIGGDFGPENYPHSHAYRLELELSGETLDQHNFLVDIVEIEAKIARQISRYKDHLLNELPEFLEQNPSLELFAKIVCQNLAEEIPALNVNRILLRLWENQNAWASFELER